jgi:hypothetical protein
MPLGQLGEGNPVFSAVYAAVVEGGVAHSHQDLFQQFAELYGARYFTIPLTSGYGDVDPSYTAGTIPNAWYLDQTVPSKWLCGNLASSAKVFRAPIPWVQAGMKLTTLSVRVSGGRTAFDILDLGHLYLISRQLDNEAAWTTVATISADPWLAAGSGTVAVAVNHTAVQGREYALEIASYGSDVDDYVCDCCITAAGCVVQATA